MVPDRDCGACTVCCRTPPIDAPDFQKPSGVLCGFCEEGVGCTVYASRPGACRDWFCGWRALPLLDRRWRPDASGVMIVLGDDEAPPSLAPYQSTKFVIVEPEWRPDRMFIGYLGALLAADAATYLAVPGPPMHHQLKSLLNPALGPLAKRRDDASLAQGVLRIAQHLRLGPFERVSFRHSPLPPQPR